MIYYDNNMKFAQIKQHEGQCCPESLIKGDISQKLHCIICYQVMTKPVTLSCGNNHTFGMACLKNWIKQKQSVACPYCRSPAHDWQFLKQMQNQLHKLEGECIYCQQWRGSLIKLPQHEDSCQGYEAHLRKQLQHAVSQEIKQLDIQINPHLKECHKEIYDKYVQDWKWLWHDLRDWKWWWWCENPWWGKVACKTCNILWHKYQKKIDLLQAKRINLIQMLNNKFIETSIKDLFQEI